jgi:hypothetical protein
LITVLKHVMPRTLNVGNMEHIHIYTQIQIVQPGRSMSLVGARITLSRMAFCNENLILLP